MGREHGALLVPVQRGVGFHLPGIAERNSCLVAEKGSRQGVTQPPSVDQAKPPGKQLRNTDS